MTLAQVGQMDSAEIVVWKVVIDLEQKAQEKAERKARSGRKR